MNNGVTITVNAETAEAAEKVAHFFKGFGDGVKELSGASHFFGELKAQILAAVSVGALVEFTREAINGAAALVRLKQETGLSLKLLSSLKEEAGRTGKDFNELGMSLANFSRLLGAAIRQGGETAQGFRDLVGIESIREFASGTITMDTMLRRVIDAFNKLPEGAQKSELAVNMFGRAGYEVLPVLDKLREGIGEGAINPEMAQASEEFARTLRSIKSEFETLFVKLAQQLLPALKQLVVVFRDIIEGGNAVGDSFRYVIEAIDINIIKVFANGLIETAALFGKLFIAAAAGVARYLDSAFTGVLNRMIDWINKHPSLATFLADTGKTQLERFKSSDVNGEEKDKLKKLQEGAELLKSAVGGFLDTQIADIRYKSRKATKAARGESGEGAGDGAPEDLERIDTGVMGADRIALSEAAKQLVKEIDQAYAEATKGKLAVLDEEEKQLLLKLDKEVLDEQTRNDEKLKILATYGAKRREILNQQNAAEIEIQLAAVQGRRALVEGDPNKSDIEKKQDLLKLLQQENELLQKNIALNAKRVGDQALTPEARLLAQKQLQELQQRQAQNRLDTTKTGQLGTFGGEFNAISVDIQNRWVSWAHQLADVFKTAFEGATSSIGHAMAGLILQTKSWKEAWQDIRNGVLKSVETALGNILTNIIQMGLQWVATHVIMGGALTAFHILARALGWESTGEVIAQEASKAPVLAVNASNASTSSYGFAAIIGIAAMVAAIGIGVAAALGAFDEGGYTGSGGRYQVAGVVHRDEYVFSAPAVAALGVGHLDALHSQALTGSSRSGGGSSMNLLLVNDESRIPKWARTVEGEAHVVNIVRRNMHRIQ